MLIPPRTRQKERIVMRMFLSSQLQRRSLGLIRPRTISRNVRHGLETFRASFAAAQAAHPRGRKNRGYARVLITGSVRLKDIPTWSTTGDLTACRPDVALTGPVDNLR